MNQIIESQDMEYIIPTSTFYNDNESYLAYMKLFDHVSKKLNLYKRVSKAELLWEVYKELVPPEVSIIDLESDSDIKVKAVPLKDLIIRAVKVNKRSIVFHAKKEDEILCLIVKDEQSDVMDINNSLPLAKAV
jgi:hypothetical protein